MFLFVRRTLDKLLPTSIKYSLVRTLPNIEIFFASSFRGIEKLWRQDLEFTKCYRESQKRSLLDVKKAYVLYLCAKGAARISGHFAEFGVFRGAGSRLMLAASNRQKRILLFDTFEGLPETSREFDKDWSKGSLGGVSIDDLRAFLKEDNFEFYKGYFPESAKEVPDDARFSFVHIDFDLYQSTLDALKYCYERLTPSGVILVDDYGVLGCPGVRKAVDEFFSDKPEMIIPNLNGQCIIVKG